MSVTRRVWPLDVFQRDGTPYMSRSTSLANSSAIVLLDHLAKSAEELTVFVIRECVKNHNLEGLHITEWDNLVRQLPGSSVSASGTK
eukprot:16160184-Heterocapsa_arctica.AAC.1